MEFYFSPIVGMMIQSDEHIFQGVGIPPTSIYPCINMCDCMTSLWWYNMIYINRYIPLTCLFWLVMYLALWLLIPPNTSMFCLNPRCLQIKYQFSCWYPNIPMVPLYWRCAKKRNVNSSATRGTVFALDPRWSQVKLIGKSEESISTQLYMEVSMWAPQ